MTRGCQGHDGPVKQVELDVWVRADGARIAAAHCCDDLTHAFLAAPGSGTPDLTAGPICGASAHAQRVWEAGDPACPRCDALFRAWLAADTRPGAAS